MNRLSHHLPLAVVALAALAMALHGPIGQLTDYHHFADASTWLGIPHAGDVLSNAIFALVALWGLVVLAPQRTDPAQADGAAGYGLFLVALLATAFGSTWYHLAPDNARLVWDRLPIALACAGLLAGVWGDTRGRDSGRAALLLALYAAASVAWWRLTDLAGADDLRPYVLLQGAPMLLVPWWQMQARRPARERLAFGAALALYALAKAAELNDHALAALLPMTGHTLKHLLAGGAAAAIVGALVARGRETTVVVTRRLSPAATR